jgi:serine protease Do
MAIKIKNILTLSLSALLLCTTSAYCEDNPQDNEALLKQISKGFSNIAKTATPAVVYIESQIEEKNELPLTKKGPFESPFDYFNDDFFNRFFGFPFENKKQSKKAETVRGSGFFVSKDGYIVTNNHVVELASKVTVTLSDGKKMSASVVGTDPKTDLAVIKIDGDNYAFLTFGDSDALGVGDWAIAIGNPFGLQATVTVGVISAKGRNQLHIADFEDFIQTDAAINPGNSGGPLLNIDSKVIGVNTAIVSGSGGYMGIGFAIPSNMTKQIMNQLIKTGQVTRGFLGVTLQPVDADLASFYKLQAVQGALITDIVKGSPADAAGLKQEDIILSYNNVIVENLSTFRNFVAMLSPGTKLKLKVMRDGKEIDLIVTVQKLPEEVTGPNTPLQKLGLAVQELTTELAQKLGVESKGVVITEVTPGSPAAQAALKAGSVIVAVNRQKVSNMTEFTAAMNEAAKNDCVLLMVRQNDAIRFIALRFE